MFGPMSSPIMGHNGSIAYVGITISFDFLMINGTDTAPFNFLDPDITLNRGPPLIFFNPLTDKNIAIKVSISNFWQKLVL